MSKLNGLELLQSWKDAQRRGQTQSEHADEIGLPWSTYKSRIWRAQKLERDMVANPMEEPEFDKKEYQPVHLRSAVFDIETMDFVSGGLMNFLVCVSILPLDEEEPYTLSLLFEDEGDDRRLLQETMDELSKFDILIGHNVAAYDFNWLYSRLMYHNMPSPPKRWLYYDTYQGAKRMAIKARRKSLGFLGDYFCLDGEKTAVLPVAWQRVASRHKKEFEAGMSSIEYHCEQDVILNRNLFFVLWPRDIAARNLPFTKKW